MMRVLLSLLVFLPLAFANAQVCEPDLSYTDSTGVYPLPKSAVNPTAGITECAVIGEPYSFTFTVAVGDSITINFAGSEFRLPLDSVVVNSVANLPAGINYACEPGNCSFPKESLGCAVLTGTPLSSVTPGDYLLVITGTAYFPVFPSTFQIDFPGSFFPGEYILRVLANSTDECGLVSANETLAEKLSLTISPNPTAGPMNIVVNAAVSGNFDLRVVDLLGQVAHQEKVSIAAGDNRVELDGSHLANGLYLLVLENELGTVSRKISVQH